MTSHNNYKIYYLRFIYIYKKNKKTKQNKKLITIHVNLCKPIIT